MHDCIFLFNISNHSNIHHIPLLLCGSFEGDGEGVGEVLGYGGNSLGVGRSVGGARRVPHTCSNVYKTLVTMPGFDLNIHE